MALRNGSEAARSILNIVDYLSPISIALYYLIAVTLSMSMLQKPKTGTTIARLRIVATILLVLIILTYIGQVAIYLTRLIQHGWWATEQDTIQMVASLFVWAILYVRLIGTKAQVWHPYLGSWVLGLGFEAACALLSGYGVAEISIYDKLVLALDGIRVVLFVALIVNGILLVLNPGDVDKPVDEERRSLLGNDSTQAASAPNTNPPGYEFTDSDDDGDDSDDEIGDGSAHVKEQQRKRLEEQGGWWSYLKSFGIFLPYLWPSDNWKAKGCLFLMFTGLVIDRVLRVLTPRQVGVLTDKITETAGTGVYPWTEFLIWMFLRWINSASGFAMITEISKVYVWCWSSARISDLAFTHTMNLSMDFHSNKDSGEVVKAMEQAQSLCDLLELVVFDIAPIIVDLFIALIYVSILFSAYLSLILIITAVVFIWLGVVLTDWQRPKRQLSNKTRRAQHKMMFESISNWQTVSYFNRKEYERKRYNRSVKNALDANFKYSASGFIGWGAQIFVITTSLMCASLFAIHQIVQGEKLVGDFITLLFYWEGVMWPLNRMSYSYRQVSTTLIDAERLLQLLQTKPTVTNAPDAKELQVTEGKIEFDHVNFSYDSRKKTLKDISFVAEPGQTVAFVGETGGGKSTTLKLLFRFYDVSSGSIKIDGNDIRNVTLESLRDALGVVPQDPSLFNQSIMDNLKYAKLDATDGDVEEACKAAAIYDKILSFPDKFKSKVGERGVKLSGGELQRTAIARVLLRNPKVVLLDEATSAVDSKTEAQIQDAFDELSVGRTTFVIAHRLSTIMDADLILVIDQGEIVERGTHDDLLMKGGKYFELWTKQTEGRRSRATSRATSRAPSRAPSQSPNATGQPLIVIDDVSGQT